MTVLAKPLNLGKLRAMLDRLPGQVRGSANAVSLEPTSVPPGPPARDC